MLNNDPEWLEITDHNLDEYNAHQNIVQAWKKHSHELRLWLPSDEELLRRWWRLMFVCFVQRSLRKNGYPKHPYKQWGTEEYILNRYPFLRELWYKQRLKLMAFIPLIQTLRKRWWMNKRHDLCKRWQRDRTRKVKRRLRMERVLGRLLWCQHKRCWLLRINLLIALFVISILIYFSFFA